MASDKNTGCIEKQKRKDELVKFYRENQNFLNKIIIGGSSIAIPLLLSTLRGGVIPFNSSRCSNSILGLCLFAFFSIITLQVIAARKASDGCELLLSEDEKKIEDGDKKCETARTLDIWSEWIFVASIFITTLTIFIAIVS